jgi:hypothetical protein
VTDAAPVAFDYALIRVVPDVREADAWTAGVVLHARQRQFLGVRFVEPPERWAQRVHALDAALLASYLRAFETVAAGGTACGPIGLHPPSERFHWLTAVRSTVVQTTPVRTGVARDPEAALAQIAAELAAS